MTKKKTPWQWLEDWQRSDLTPEQRSYEWIRTEMQHRWPGPYRLVRNPWSHRDLYGVAYVMQFVDPQEETMFRLRWS